MHVLTQDYLKSILDYNQETGIFIWKERPIEMFKTKLAHNSWNTRYSNKKAGCININKNKNHQYLQIMINNKGYKAHRLAWLYIYGEFPECVDAIDRNYLNLKINNLRSSTYGDNSHKRIFNGEKLPAGVQFMKNTKSNKIYKSKIQNNGKMIHLGVFETAEEAHEAYAEAKRMISPEYCML